MKIIFLFTILSILTFSIISCNYIEHDIIGSWRRDFSSSQHEIINISKKGTYEWWSYTFNPSGDLKYEGEWYFNNENEIKFYIGKGDFVMYMIRCFEFQSKDILLFKWDCEATDTSLYYRQ